MNSLDLKNKKFSLLQLTGVWKLFLGFVTTEQFIMMLYGGAGSGKSCFAIKFAYFLAKLNNKVLYISNEEKYSPTLKYKFDFLKAYHKNIDIASDLTKLNTNYKYVVIDSVNSLGLTADDIAKLKNKYKTISFIIIFQVTKSGLFRGSNEFIHNCDIAINIVSGTAQNEKNRFGGQGTLKIF